MSFNLKTYKGIGSIVKYINIHINSFWMHNDIIYQPLNFQDLKPYPWILKKNPKLGTITERVLRTKKKSIVYEGQKTDFSTNQFIAISVNSNKNFKIWEKRFLRALRWRNWTLPCFPKNCVYKKFIIAITFGTETIKTVYFQKVFILSTVCLCSQTWLQFLKVWLW